MVVNTISEEGAIVPLPVKKTTKSSRRRAARKRAEASREEAICAPSCSSAPSAALVSFCKKLWLPDTLAMELSELGAFEPMHLIDLGEADKSSLTLKSLEMKRLVKAISELAVATTASSAPSTSSFATKAVAAPAVPFTMGSAPTKVKKAAAAAAAKPPAQKQYSEYLVVGDPRLKRLNESDLLYLLREIPICAPYLQKLGKGKGVGRGKGGMKEVGDKRGITRGSEGGIGMGRWATSPLPPTGHAASVAA